MTLQFFKGERSPGVGKPEYAYNRRIVSRVGSATPSLLGRDSGTPLLGHRFGDSGKEAGSLFPAVR